MADRAYLYQVRLHERTGHFAHAEAFVAEHGDTVLYGPCAGLRYPARRLASLQKRLGLYERELHDWLWAALDARPARIINIGASDGYYAVGLAMQGLTVDAYELSVTARADMHELAQSNGVVVNIRRTATGRRLRELDLRHALVLSDCEGAEVDIFDIPTVYGLRSATVIVEVHGDVKENAESILRERFKHTHTCKCVAPRAVASDDREELARLSPQARRAALDEMRTDYTPWLLFEPRDA